ncbi:MAG: PAQR family membrane homeostasis protein TrhA [Desulfonatronovibrionaceae bacterium]
MSTDRSARGYSPTEELFNGLTHGLGLLLSLVGLVVLVIHACTQGSAWHVLSFSVFGISLVFLYLSSALYHSLKAPRQKTFFKKMDHSAIFLLIAGTYTPFMLINLRGPWGWSIFGAVWGLALLGIILKWTGIHRFRRLSLVLYLGMGWMCLIALKEMITHVPAVGLYFLLAGGFCYSAGVVFYVRKTVRFSHTVWHIFVLAGSALHYFAVLSCLG